jgi:flagellar hook-associated protein 3 FlgL
MGPIGSPTLRAHTLIQQSVSSIRERLDAVRSEAVTGKVADVGRAVNGDTGKVDRLSEALAYAEDRVSVLSFEGNRAQAAQNILSAVRSQTEDVRGDTLLAITASGEISDEAAALRGLSGFGDAIARLNSEFGGRPLFGGDSGVTPLADADAILDDLRTIIAAAPTTGDALADIGDYFDDPAGGFATARYLGGDGAAPTVEISRTERVSTTVSASDDALRDTLRGLALVALSGEAADTDARDQFLEAGASQLGGAIEGVIELQSRIGTREERIASAQVGYEAQITSLGLATNALTGRDQAEAATEMRLLESQLEASYLTTSRLANLSLVNYLR